MLHALTKLTIQNKRVKFGQTEEREFIVHAAIATRLKIRED